MPEPMNEAVDVTLEDCKMIVHDKVRELRQVYIRVYPDGTRAMSFDEYNRILRFLYEQDRRKRRAEERKRAGIDPPRQPRVWTRHST